VDELADIVAKRVCAYLEKRLQPSGVRESFSVCGPENGIANWRSDVEHIQT
jgi:hypothetical protein